MNPKKILTIGLFLLITSQLLMSFGYDFIMAQKPIDFAHWTLLLAALAHFSLWFALPSNGSKPHGLGIMSLGIAGIIGMCTIDFVLWSLNDNPTIKDSLLGVVMNDPTIKFPFLIVGPTLFYMGICISTYGLFKKYKWQVIVLNIGALLIGIGHLIFGNQVIPVFGAVLLSIGLLSIIQQNQNQQYM
ncbi:hypothetical protein DFQ05_0924 [Winogradskyella wandonensis]|uniref:Uncharacterized protein n=1 Tax=Winogradskyella wandonensis TaxID=1442586 RepID=A0A4R1KXV1_9FLAO|nr:hypothetical protein [Winogradskyella wandonensis]TCK69403.1 hypothetical protein DFQ05_0924 [Winogradskyella wandonensis]